MPQISAGLLMYRITRGQPEVFLVHPGGPYFRNRDKGWWTIPKGLPAEGEALEKAAFREFEEETGYRPGGKHFELGAIKQKGGKTVHAWACEDDIPDGWTLKTNTFELEWPPRSGRKLQFPEVDKGRFFTLEEAAEYINEAQRELLNRLKEKLS